MLVVIELVVDALAVHRLTRLVTDDEITAPLRDGLIAAAYVAAADGETFRESAAQSSWSEVARVDPDAPKLATLLTCRWCASVWVSLGVAAARVVAPRAWRQLARALALSSAAALVAGLEQG